MGQRDDAPVPKEPIIHGYISEISKTLDSALSAAGDIDNCTRRLIHRDPPENTVVASGAPAMPKPHTVESRLFELQQRVNTLNRLLIDLAQTLDKAV